MNILSSIVSFLTFHSQQYEKNSSTVKEIDTTPSHSSSPVNSEEKIAQKMFSNPREFPDADQIDRQNIYQPRFLPDFACDNLNYLSSHPALRLPFYRHF
ncbi:hypothetical protein [Limnoraphis robusta]|uniref:Uncharacterized protein n=1 Tax=Limnoraphis robusta CCNP1315 TaxID=3110306 RepID=A0ABU5U2K5_9CYAN|nr:hypothetical protein [Limnoraphis robusta]MEA5521423.1 hypothetical protein [Limnoraphis robusta CCNP1315]MEA5546494.1 hypothetical protein [Limnoraphis robusta CCNP1324]